ncbi:MAG: ATP-binding protein [Anaerolineae bacterium]|nr:ATP-binding protein [Thermoflexales bacterium]MDW8406385.1 ATP-binding protein [Anaerolineae bacterium]
MRDSVSSPAAKASWPAELQQTLRQLQNEVLLWAVVGLFLFGACMAGLSAQSVHLDHSLILALVTFGLTGLVWWLRRRYYRAAVLVLTFSATALAFATVAWAGLTLALPLLALPVGLATLMLGGAAGLSLATGCSLLIVLLPDFVLPASAELRLIALIAVWGTAGMSWAALQPLLTTVRWVWEGYAREHDLFEHIQNTHVQLTQTLNDLKSANLQLMRLTHIADGLRQTAEEALRAKEQFVANVSHELRTPLNMIIGFSEMVLNAPQVYGAPIPPPLMADLAVILRNSRHLSDLIDDVLDLSQIEAGRMAVVKERVNLREIVEAATTAVRPLFQSKGLSLHAHLPDDLPAVSCDRTRIREVLLNLLSNAGRFTERGGTTVSVVHHPEANEIVVSVADTGPGIAEADKERVFQPFQQLDGSIRRRHGGSGLGLTISKRFVELHGGRMWFESTPGQGATFFFTLPLDTSPPPSNAARWLNPDWLALQHDYVPTTLPALKPRLMVVDSTGVLQRLLMRYLEGIEVVCAPDLSTALDELARAPAYMLIVNTLHTEEWLLQLGAADRLPYGTPLMVCAVAGHADVANDLGVSDYLVKPIDQEELLKSIERAIGNDSHASASGGRRVILVVDDEPDARRLYWRMLSGPPHGYFVLTAEDARQAVELMRSQRPDVVVLDLVMPDVNGFQLLAMKHNDPDLKSIPVIVVSARDPAGQPIVSSAIGVTRSGGLSLHQLLGCIDNLSRLLSPAPPRSADRAQPADARG